MQIGDAARASGVSAKMIRYYESTGLIPAADRRQSNYRDYDAGDIDRLRFIRRSRDLGFTMAEIRDLLNLWHDRNRKSADVRRIAAAHISGLHHRIAEMQAIAGALERLVASCAGDGQAQCAILDDLVRG